MDLPLRDLRAGSDKHGFCQLDNDDGLDPSIKVTTDISVSQKARGAPEESGSGMPA